MNFTPNPKTHFYISILKSGFRIWAGWKLIKGDAITAGVLLISAEILGIVEEL